MKEFPKKFKYGRIFRIKLKNKQISVNFLNIWFYEYGLKALENGKLRLNHLNAFIRLMKRKFKKELSFRLNASLIIPVTKKPREVRMGKGKGQRDHWECIIKKGMILFEVGGLNISKQKLFRTLNLIREKLPVQTNIVKLTY
jgi:large subunit ribosomal protein L16